MNRRALLEAGRGELGVLLLHGVGGGKAIWGSGGSDSLAALAAAGYRAAALDFPGYGDAAADGPPTLDAMVAAARAVIDAGPAGRWIAVGHSMGGMVALELVARSPAGLVLANTSAAFGKSDGAWQAQFLAERLAPLDAGLGMAAMARQLVGGLLAPDASPRVGEIARGIMSAVPEVTYRAALQAIVGFDRREALADLRLPTLLLAAEHDLTAPPEVMRRMGERIAGSEFHVLAGASHLANIEQPEAFHAVVLAFLRRHF